MRQGTTSFDDDGKRGGEHENPTRVGMPRDKDGPVKLLVTIAHESNIEYPSG